MSLPGAAKVPYGGGYSPERWPPQVRQEDHRPTGYGVLVLREGQ